VVTTSTSPDAAGVWRAVRAPLTIVALLLLGSMITVLVSAGSGGALDPRSAEESGSMAVANLLEAEGVRVEIAGTADEARDLLGTGSTLLVTHPDRIRAEVLRGLRDRTEELVLLAPSAGTLAAVTGKLTTAGPVEPKTAPPDCALEAAISAGPLALGGSTYRSSAEAGDVEICYPRGGAGPLAGVTNGNRGLIVLGDSTPLTNAALAEAGNAALALNLLGQRPALVWYLPSAGDAALRHGEASIYDLIPDGWTFGVVQAGVAVVLLALWRARRLGPVVTEPLPVVVRAAETVEGRARLYRRAGAAEHAARALRKAALDRMLPSVGLSGAEAADPRAVAMALARRTGRDPAEVWALLYDSSSPGGDSELVALAEALDGLERDCASAIFGDRRERGLQ
jgi:hypothetical protein